MKNNYSFSAKLITSVVSVLFFVQGFSATIKGHIKDAKNTENLVGAVVYLKDSTKINDAAGLDGSYSLKNIGPGSYTVVVKFFGYITQEAKVTVSGANDEVVQDFTMQPDSLTLEQVQIVGSYDKESDNYAIGLERTLNYEVNILSAKTMQLMPDITVGSVLQRVSGVVIEKSVSGGGKFATIRGMDKRYNYVTINGVKVPSPDYNNNYVPLDLFPSAILGRLEVVKTLRPDMYGDAIGGATNLVLKTAPDYLSLTGDLATGYGQSLFNNNFNSINTSGINQKSPEQINGANYAATPTDFATQPFIYNIGKSLPDILGDFTFGNRYLHNKLGVLLSASYQNTYSSTSSFFLSPSAQPSNTPNPNTPLFDDVEIRTYSTQEQRDAAHLKLDYEFNPKNKISFYAVYVGLNQFRSDFKVDTTFQTLKVNHDYETKVTYENIFSSSLQGQDSLAHNLLLDWTGSYARGYSNTPDWGTLSATNGGTAATASDFYYNGWGAKWWQNTDQTFTGLINLIYKCKVLKQDVLFKVGAMNEDKGRVDYYEDYSFNPASNSPPLYTPNGLTNSMWVITDPNGTPTDGNNYTVQQDITAIYGMTEFKIGSKISVMGGLRGENTLLSYNTPIPVDQGAEWGNIHYIDYLPSGEVSYAINNKQAIRASYFSSISRPSFNDLMPYQITGDYYTEIGNPYLLHTQAQNYDLRYEFFPSSSEQILAGVFYKNIIDPIEYTLTRYKASTQYLQPVNDTNKAFSYGFELVVTKYIKNFGISANYTYNKSQTTVPDAYYYVTPSGAQTNTTLNETRPLQGQAENIGNISLLYKSTKAGLDMNLSGVYTGKLIASASPDYGLDLWQLPQFRLDFAFEKRLSKKCKISIYGKVNNILNTALKIVMYPPSEYNNAAGTASTIPGQSSNGNLSTILQEQEIYGQSYILGFRYKF